jgi:hypothetical protein
VLYKLNFKDKLKKELEFDSNFKFLGLPSILFYSSIPAQNLNFLVEFVKLVEYAINL